MHKQTVVEEYIAFNSELKSQYVGHISTATGSSQSTVNCIVHYFASNEIRFLGVAAVEHDEAAVEKGVFYRF